MTSPWVASFLAIFAWWFSTGVILMVVRRADRLGTHGMTVFSALPMVALGIWAVSASLQELSALGAYLGFAGALAIWGWIELAFLAGVITGPQREDCPPNLKGGARFRLTNRNGTARFSGMIAGSYQGVEPLVDFGMDHDCYVIEYLRDGKWVRVRPTD